MVTITEAKTIIRDNVRPAAPAELSLEHAAGLVLAADVFAMSDIPAYPQSAMDGYAFSYEGWNRYKELLIDGEMAAGSNCLLEVEPQTAVRIFTGAAIPPGADTVVMQEKVQVENNKLIIEDGQLRQGVNVRPPASEIKAGELALPEGHTAIACSDRFSGRDRHNCCSRLPETVCRRYCHRQRTAGTGPATGIRQGIRVQFIRTESGLAATTDRGRNRSTGK